MTDYVICRSSNETHPSSSFHTPHCLDDDVTLFYPIFCCLSTLSIEPYEVANPIRLKSNLAFREIIQTEPALARQSKHRFTLMINHKTTRTFGSFRLAVFVSSPTFQKLLVCNLRFDAHYRRGSIPPSLEMVC